MKIHCILIVWRYGSTRRALAEDSMYGAKNIHTKYL